MSIDVRPHGRWKLLDWPLLGVWVLLASVWPPFRRRYWSSIATVSVWTRTIYTPRGRELSDSTLAHELHHIEQARRDGRLRWSLRYTLSARWRVWYEAEAYYVGGTSQTRTVTMLLTMYAIWWPREHVEALVAAARGEMAGEVST